MTPKATKRPRRSTDTDTSAEKRLLQEFPVETTPDQSLQTPVQGPQIPPALASKKRTPMQISPAWLANKHERMHVRRKLFEDDDDMYGEASGSWNQSKPTWLAENWNAPFVQESLPEKRTSQRDRDQRNNKKAKFEEQMRFVVSHESEEQFEVVDVDEKGKGLATKVDLQKDSIVIQYRGKLLDSTTGQERKQKYNLSGDRLRACCVFEFKWGEKKYCIDPSVKNAGKARFMNHSKKNANVKPKIVTACIGEERCPLLVFKTIRHIAVGEELVYDYGDRSAEAIQSCPWLKE